ncbi:MAG: HAMP domain-containing histidine kinase [Candidatus Thiodiazotropha sp. (ex Troendleina suluensis)]|nr:HAMP domain-containing histidine kinase [Candidatus Thiodiazotropha sp. (ex Troendleina suluensis)]
MELKSKVPPISLKKLLLYQHLLLLTMLAMSALLGGTWIIMWQNASAESLLINGLLRESQHLYTDIYRQAREANVASRTSDNLSVTQYWDHVYDMDARFARLEQGLYDQSEAQAILAMRNAYSMMQTQINVLLTEQERTNAHLLIDNAVERWITGAFSDAYSTLSRILDARSKKVEERLERWNRLAIWLFPIPLLTGALVVLFTHQRLEKMFSKPMLALSHGAMEIAQGHLEHSIKETGVTETRSLASSINCMAIDLKQAREQILEQERQTSLQRLVPMVAHNIRNPLATIRAVAQAADPEDSLEEQNETKQSIISTVDRLERWTTSLLDYLNPFKPQLVVINADEFLKELVVMADTQAELREIELVYQLYTGLQFNADLNLLEQALHGLLINAIEASPTGSKVFISVLDNKRSITILIEDQGPGMAYIPDENSKGPGPSTKTHGTGIGIPFAIRVCQAHGGELHFGKSSQGGTAVSFQLVKESI